MVRFALLTAHVRECLLVAAYPSNASGYIFKGDEMNEIIDGHQERMMKKLGMDSRSAIVRFGIRECITQA